MTLQEKVLAVESRATGVVKAHAANLHALLEIGDPWIDVLRTRLDVMTEGEIETILRACSGRVRGEGFEETRRFFITWAEGTEVERAYYKGSAYAFKAPADRAALVVYHDCLVELRGARVAGDPLRQETIDTAIAQVRRLGGNAPREAWQLLLRDLNLAGVEYGEAERLAKTVVEVTRERRSDAG